MRPHRTGTVRPKAAEKTDRVALEATTNAWLVVELLRPFVAAIVVGNPLKTKAVAEAKIKTDKVDAEVLANLLRCDYLPEVRQGVTMNGFSWQVLVICVTILAGNAGRMIADGGCCDRCGDHTTCKKVCHLVCEEKKIEVTCWGGQCEEFCVPGPSKPGCKHCEVVCGQCDEHRDAKTRGAKPQEIVWTEWIPGCATVHTKKKLMKRTGSQKIPSYKWVVEELYGRCQANCNATDALPDADMTPTASLGPK